MSTQRETDSSLSQLQKTIQRHMQSPRPGLQLPIFAERSDRVHGLLETMGTWIIEFDSSGLQTSVTDRNGNQTTYAYDGSDRLMSTTDPVSRVTTFTYTGNLLSTITDPAGATTSLMLLV